MADPFLSAYWFMLVAGAVGLAVLGSLGHIHFGHLHFGHHGLGHGGAGAHVGVPHAGAPAAHVGAPHVGAPHAGAAHVGTSHAGAPHVGAPHAGPAHVGAPHAGAPHVGAPHAGAPPAGAQQPGPAHAPAHGAETFDMFSWFSPFVLSTLVMFTGVGGVASVQAGISGPLSLGPAVGCGLVLAAGVVYGCNALVRTIQGSSHIRLADLANTEAEVITPVPETGCGEIAYVGKRSRRTAPARSADGTAIPKGSQVTILRQEGAVFLVRPTMEERLRLLKPSEPVGEESRQ